MFSVLWESLGDEIKGEGDDDDEKANQRLMRYAGLILEVCVVIPSFRSPQIPWLNGSQYCTILQVSSPMPIVTLSREDLSDCEAILAEEGKVTAMYLRGQCLDAGNALITYSSCC